MKLMKNAVPHTIEGIANALQNICLIHCLPPNWAYKLPLKYPLIMAVAAYTNIATLSIDPRINIIYKSKLKIRQ